MRFSIYTSCNNHRKLLLSFFAYKFVCKRVMGKVDGYFSRSNETSWKNPNTIYNFTGIMSYSGTPPTSISLCISCHKRLNKTSRHQIMYQSTRSTGFLVFVCLFHCFTCHSNLRNSENNLVWKPLKRTRIVYSTSAIILLPCETHYFSKYGNSYF